MRKIGPGDISYCNTNCFQERCKRNLRYWKPPTKYYSVCSYDDQNEDALHINCIWKWLAEEEKKRGRPKKDTSRE